jgi:hypothetical protein
MGIKKARQVHGHLSGLLTPGHNDVTKEYCQKSSHGTSNITHFSQPAQMTNELFFYDAGEL